MDRHYPDYQDVLDVVRADPGNLTYVYKNKLQAAGFKNLPTSVVLRRLKGLAELGRVRRINSICEIEYRWGLASGGNWL